MRLRWTFTILLLTLIAGCDDASVEPPKQDSVFEIEQRKLDQARGLPERLTLERAEQADRERAEQIARQHQVLAERAQRHLEAERQEAEKKEAEKLTAERLDTENQEGE